MYLLCIMLSFISGEKEMRVALKLLRVDFSEYVKYKIICLPLVLSKRGFYGFWCHDRQIGCLASFIVYANSTITLCIPTSTL